LGCGCSSGQNGEEHQKLWRKIEKLGLVFTILYNSYRISCYC
jgi:hypothetical protein